MFLPRSIMFKLLAVMLSVVALSNWSTNTFAAESPRQRLSMDFGWKFMLGDPSGAERMAFDATGWQAVDLPHDWSIGGAFDEEAPAGGGGAYLPTGIGWYRRTFRIPDSFKGKQVAVEFDGVYENSDVWINNHWLGKRPFGYIGFSYDLTPYLNFGDADNVIAVRVDNSVQPNSRWYSGSGIYRHTWLTATDPLAIARWGTFVTSPRVSEKDAAIQVAVQVVNRGNAAAEFTLVCAVLDADGNEVQTGRSRGEVDAGATGEFQPQLTIERPMLWSDVRPYLYTVRCTLLSGGKVVDQYDTPIGIRSIAFDVDKGFLLNGKHVKLNGVCLHGDGGSVGAAVPEGVWLRRLQLLKEMGCNAIRTSHNPPTPEFLDLCDRLGFLVMDEAFDEWESGKTLGGYHRFFGDWSQRDLVDFIHRDRNHPCVVLWSAGNEIEEQVLTGGAEILGPLVATYHREDPTRLVTAACDKLFAEPISAPPGFPALLDVVGYNYVDRWLDRADLFYSVDRRDFPNRRFIGTESISMGGTRGDYRSMFPDEAGEVRLPATLPATNASRRRFRQLPASNRRIDVEQLWQFVQAHDYVAGDFMWTGIDYLGEAFWPSRSASFGVLDTCGFKKDGFYFYQSQWTSKPVLHLFPHWNWKGREGQIIPVTCYTNCDTVELLVNGKSFGVKGYEFPKQGMEERYGNMPARARAVRTTADLHLSWDVPYEAGTLRAVGKIEGKVVASEEIKTAGEPASIELSADKTELTADGRDVAHLTVRILDADGIVVPTADNDVTFELEGAGRIIGVDSGDPASVESFKGIHHKAFNGLCLAIVQTARDAGSIRITASSTGLRAATVELNSKAADQSGLLP
jgi:beta-galactosidase